MDDLTPMDPECREAAPETPPETPCYYGTGRQPEKRSSHLPVIIVLVCLLAAANFITVFALLELKRSQTPSVSPSTGSEPIALTPSENVSAAPDPMQEEENGGQMILQQSPEGVLPLWELYQKVMPSVVTVLAEPNTVAGTGIVLSHNGYIITNARTVQKAASLKIRTNDGEIYDARLVGSDSSTDLAVLKAEIAALVPAEFGDSDELQPGDSVVAISNPFGQDLGATMSQGIIAAVNENVELSGKQISVLQTNASLDADSAGGPLFNDSGQVVGFNIDRVGSLVSYETVPHIGFAIPTREAKAILRELIADGYVSGRASLGLEVMDIPAGSRIYWKLPAGVMVRSIYAQSAACAAGLRTGDVIVGLNDVSVENVQDFETALDACQVGQTVRVYIYRGGNRYYADLIAEDAEKYG